MKGKIFRFRLVLAGALAVQLILQAWFALSHSSAFDEPFFISAGLTLWNTGRDGVLVDQPPAAKRLYGLSAVLAGGVCEPGKRDYMGAWTLYRLNRDRVWPILLSCRAAAIAASLLLTLVTALWALELAGPAAGALAACFLALEPNTLALGSLATADILLSLALMLFVRSAWRIFSGTGGLRGAAMAGLWAGLALSTKYSALGYLPAIFLAAALARLITTGKNPVPPRPIWAAGLGASAALGAVLLLFSFHIRFWDAGFGKGGPFSWSPVGFAGDPLNDFVMGVMMIFSWVNVDVPVFILGRLWSGRLPWYFPAAILLKIQLGLLLAAAATLAFHLWRPGRTRPERARSRPPLARRNRPIRRTGMVSALLPAFCIVAVLAVAAFSRLHVGIRHVHVVFPLFAVLAAGLAGPLLNRPKLRAILAGLFLLWCAGSTARSFPHFLAHFNELAGGPGGGWRFLADSNLDWGQDLPELSRWCRENGIKQIPLEYFGNSDPAWWGVPAVPFRDHGSPGYRPGLAAVSVGAIDGVLSHDLARFAWCRGMKPVATPGWSIRIYDLRK